MFSGADVIEIQQLKSFSNFSKEDTTIYGQNVSYTYL